MKYILCIDIGGTRIKSAVVPEFPTLEQMKNAPAMVVRTLGWLNHSLPQLVDPNHWASLSGHYRNKGVKYDAIALSVPGVIDSEGFFHRPDLTDGPAKVPKELIKSLSKAAGCPVSIVKDADSWMMGYQAYAMQKPLEAKFPAVLLAFGTGLGISASVSMDAVISIEASARPAESWRQLKQISGYNITEGWHVHHIVGRQFFEYVDRDHKEWDHLKIREEYTKRVKAVLLDILPWIEKSTGPIRTVVLAGGNAEYVSVRGLSDTGKTIISLADRQCDLESDLITVMGVEASARKSLTITLQ
jgi:hypothetical protein